MFPRPLRLALAFLEHKKEMPRSNSRSSSRSAPSRPAAPASHPPAHAPQHASHPPAVAAAPRPVRLLPPVLSVVHPCQNVPPLLHPLYPLPPPPTSFLNFFCALLTGGPYGHGNGWAGIWHWLCHCPPRSRRSVWRHGRRLLHACRAAGCRPRRRPSLRCLCAQGLRDS